ncbi:MAG: RyR domain-containing protein [Opitutales bacterium]|nr:RyR domain-containing protein [Opitutales bacterium]
MRSINGRLPLLLILILQIARFGTGVTSWFFIVLISLVSCLFGLLGFLDSYQTIGWAEFLDAAFQTIQLFVLEFDAKDDINTKLQIARFSACFVVFSSLIKTAFQAFDKELSNLLTQTSKGHVIVFGASPRGIRLAIELANQKQDVVLVDTILDTNVVIPYKPNLKYYRGDSRTISVMQSVNFAHCNSFFLAHESDEINFDILVAANKSMDGVITTVKQCFLHAIQMRKLASVINELRLPQIDLRLYNYDDIIVRSLTNVFKADAEFLLSDDGEIYILGNSHVTQALLKQIARSYLKPTEDKLNIILISENATKTQAYFYECYPESKNLINLQAVDASEHTVAFKKFAEKIRNRQNAIFFICNECDTAGIFDFLDLVDDFKVPVSNIALQQSDGIAFKNALGAGNHDISQIQLFGLIDENCSLEAIMAETLDQLARVIHEKYLTEKLNGGAKAGSTGALLPWRELSEQYKQANRAQAAHINTKLRIAGIRTKKTIEQNTRFEFTAAEIELLARIEHRRWAAERYLDGWSFGEVRDDIAKLHPDLIPWEKLSDEIKGYDREPIKQIPELLNQIGLCLVR